MITLAICGCGSRGLYAYAWYQKVRPDRLKVVAGADPRPDRLRRLRKLYDVPEDMCFASDAELLARPKLADAVLVATQDRHHVDPALKALELGYHVILEKPISPDLKQCFALAEKARETGRHVVVCHVLRYSAFYREIERLIGTGALGEVRTLNLTENVGYWHFCHSYVRGNWRRADETSPMIMAKSCHDMDLFRWFAGARCVKIQSFGDRSFFRADRRPEGAAERCLDCGLREACKFSAEKIYITSERTGALHGRSWLPVNPSPGQSAVDAVREVLRTGPYGRCVFACDNDVADHQTVNLEFENGVRGVFTVSAFTEDCYRTIQVTGTDGELFGNLGAGVIVLRRFGERERVIDIRRLTKNADSHGGGDEGLIRGFCDLLESDGTEAPRTSVEVSVESHAMALAAEESRLQGGKTVALDEFVRGVTGA